MVLGFAQEDGAGAAFGRIALDLAGGHRRSPQPRGKLPAQREARIEELEATGVCAVVSSCSALEAVLRVAAPVGRTG
jgi:hypothetical protein